MATKVRGVLGQLGAFARSVVGKPSETRPLGKLAVGAVKVAHLLESATTGVRGPLPGPRQHQVAQLKRPIVASQVQALGAEPAAQSWTRALDSASKVVGDTGTADPRSLVGSELSFITDNLARL
ncbi:hypothetical protein GGH18_004856, partial [Coemansia sp. RSA 530]